MPQKGSLPVYLFISSQRIAGCLVAEPINEAFEVLSYLVGERQDGAIAKRRSNPIKLQFGEIVLEREVIKRAPSEVLHENHTGAILCKKEAVHAVCGIRAIWVTPSNRRKGIATQLLEAVRALPKIEPKFIIQAGKSYLNPTMPDESFTPVLKYRPGFAYIDHFLALFLRIHGSLETKCSVLPYFAKVYSFIGSVFDPGTMGTCKTDIAQPLAFVLGTYKFRC
ncbi:hypothetical protein PVK06_035180 [Gossypium arboreum]|uniref:N-acetyltransferase ESCO acetyl-transferase domain-containing protein n=1 Tax=Gossypium arboreum TaxID=29729 RepID=A0ABR0NG51_GOSAR|nr:hypothetical protein PVK06_035180 [Gossypium arboreum]